MEIKYSNEQTRKAAFVMTWNEDLLDICKKSKDYKHFKQLAKQLLNSDRYSRIDWEHPNLNTKELNQLITLIVLKEQLPSADNNRSLKAEKSK